jgi:transposase
MAIPVKKPRLLLADKGYDGDNVRDALLCSGIKTVIPPKANRKHPPACDFQADKDRNRIERMVNKLKQFRRIATRYDKTRKSFEAFLAIAAVKIWLPNFVNMVWNLMPFVWETTLGVLICGHNIPRLRMRCL